MGNSAHYSVFFPSRFIEHPCRLHLFRRLCLDCKGLLHTSRHRPLTSRRPSWYFVPLFRSFILDLIVCRVLIPCCFSVLRPSESQVCEHIDVFLDWLSTALPAGLGYICGPIVGSSLWRISHRKTMHLIEEKDKDFHRRIVKNRVNPSAQSYNNPVPDYYGVWPLYWLISY